MQHLWRNLVLLILLTGAGLAASQWYGQGAPQALPVDSAPAQSYTLAPDFTFTKLDGSTQKLSALRGKTVLLNFWASWCAPCRTEFPQFVKLADHEPDIIILALSVDHDRKAMERFLQEQPGESHKLPNFILAHDPAKAIAQDLFQSIRYPETILIDAKGQIRRKYVGLEVEWDSPAFRAELPSLTN
jgi:cytochrome c biogenesis protein CcmG, thiol:disulfide interchange protein DsbE